MLPSSGTSALSAASRLIRDTVPAPLIGFGGTYRGIRFGANVNPEMIVGVEAGVSLGPIGLSMPIIRFSLRDHSFAFVPDYNPELNVDLNGYRSVTWSAAEGFGQELGMKFPSLKGRFVYDVNMQALKNSALTSPSGVGELSFDRGQWIFTPSVPTVPGTMLPKLTGTLGSPLEGSLRSQQSDLLMLPSATIRGRLADSIAGRLPEEATPQHVIRLGWSLYWIPEKGYTWLDGTSSFREGHEADLAVRWDEGESSLFPPHLRASRREGSWEPSDGYRWLDGSRAPLPTATAVVTAVRWHPGLASADHPNIISSREEGRWIPMPGYTWATSESTDLSVRLNVP